MAATKTDIWVYAHWKGMKAPKCIGTISAQQSKGSRIFGFEYDKEWLKSDDLFLLSKGLFWIFLIRLLFSYLISSLVTNWLPEMCPDSANMSKSLVSL